MINRAEQNWPDLSKDAKAMEIAMEELGVPQGTEELKIVLRRAQKIKDSLNFKFIQG